MVTPTDRNRLEEEASPYLRAHADNPVNWQPWDERALRTAREHDVPIFLSIGYSSCHWCHVMAEESFEDPEVAERLNEHFVPIKVDREERPELDDIYMTVCRLVRGGGCGWPLSVWLTPDGDPFFVGTYFPKEGRRNQPGFLDLLEDITEQWTSQRADLEERATQWMQSARDHLEETPRTSDTLPETDLLSTAADTLVSQADREYGGFGRGQKFPHPGRLRLLTTAASRGDREDARDVVRMTLDAMIDGGLRDHLGGGFHRYCTDRSWTVPHFEKMLYDNAEIPRALLDGYRLTGEERYATVAAETLDFLADDLRHEDGGFYSSLDARSEPPDGIAFEDAEGQDTAGRGVEGAYYVWTPETVRAAIADHLDETDDRDEDDSTGVDRLTAMICDRYGIDESGNFEGTTVPTLSESVESMSHSYDASPAEIQTALDTGRQALRAARKSRPAPPRDEKVIAAWNGHAIRTLAEASLVLDAPEYAGRAREALEFAREHLWDGSRLSRRWAPVESPDTDGPVSSSENGDVKGYGYLDDYAFLAQAGLSVHGATGRVEPLDFALDLGRAMVESFWDEDAGTLYYTPIDAVGVPIRPQDIDDQSTPSSTGMAVSLLQALHAFDPDAGFESVADAVLRTHADRIESTPGQHPSLVEAYEHHRRGHIELTVSATESPGWLSDVLSLFAPELLLTRRPATADGLRSWLDTLDLEEAPPIWAGREARDGPTAYVCQRACSPPLTEPEDVTSWIRDFQGSVGGPGLEDV